MTDYIAFDTETAPTTPGNKTPPLACMSYSDGKETDLIHHEYAADAFEAIAESGATLVTHFGAYDFAVFQTDRPKLTKLIFDLFENDRVRQTNIRELLLGIKDGTEVSHIRLGLGELSNKYTGIELKKGDDSWQKRFGELIGVPLNQWPREARDYATGDAASTLKVFHKQGGDVVSPDEAHQNRAAYALHLMSAYGVRTDGEMVDRLDKEISDGVVKHEADLIGAGILQRDKTPEQIAKRLAKGLEDNSKLVQKRATLQAYVALAFESAGLDVPMTTPSKGASEDWEPSISTDKDTLEKAAQYSTQGSVLCAPDGEALTTKVIERNAFLKQRAFLEILKKATEHRWCPSWNPLVATGRTSCGSKDDPGNLQNQPRKGDIRSCFIPADDCVYLSCDFNTAELRSLAQVCYSWFGHSRLRDVFLNDGEPHVEMAAQIYGCSVEDAYALFKAGMFEDERQFAKIPNFGLPGGLGARSLVEYAWTAGNHTILELERSYEIVAAYLRAWPEMEEYFSVFSELCGDLGPKSIEQFMSGRVRGGLRYTSGCNTMFQGLTADYAKDALWEVTRRCYTVTTSALYGSRPVFFIHDEIITETPEDRMHEAAIELEECMMEAAAKWLPDVPMKVDAHAMRRWYKKAKTVRDIHGRLQCWEPERKAA